MRAGDLQARVQCVHTLGPCILRLLFIHVYMGRDSSFAVRFVHVQYGLISVQKFRHMTLNTDVLFSDIPICLLT